MTWLRGPMDSPAIAYQVGSISFTKWLILIDARLSQDIYSNLLRSLAN